MNTHFLDFVPHRVAGSVFAAGGVLLSVVEPGSTTSAIGVISIVVGGLVSVYKIYRDAEDRKLHREEFQAQLRTTNEQLSRLWRLFDATHPPASLPPAHDTAEQGRATQPTP